MTPKQIAIIGAHPIIDLGIMKALQQLTDSGYDVVHVDNKEKFEEDVHPAILTKIKESSVEIKCVESSRFDFRDAKNFINGKRLPRKKR